jgi:hypothetical protein
MNSQEVNISQVISDQWLRIEAVLRAASIYDAQVERLVYIDDSGKQHPLSEAPIGSAVRLLSEASKSMKKNDFISMRQGIMKKLVDNLPKKELVFTMYLISKVGFGNIVKGTQKDILEDLGWSTSTLSKYLTILESKGIIKRDGPKTKMRILLNPAIGFKGKFFNIPSIMRYFDPIELSQEQKKGANEENIKDIESIFESLS